MPIVMNHDSKSRSWPPTWRVPFHIGRGVAAPTRARRVKRYIEGSKNSKKSRQIFKKM